MALKAAFSRPLAALMHHRYQQWLRRPVATQKRVLASLISQAHATAFGRDHELSSVSKPSDLASQVPVRDYEALNPYFQLVQEG